MINVEILQKKQHTLDDSASVRYKAQTIFQLNVTEMCGERRKGVKPTTIIHEMENRVPESAKKKHTVPFWKMLVGNLPRN